MPDVEPLEWIGEFLKSPAVVEQIRQSEREIAEGKTRTLDEVKAAVAQQRVVVASFPAPPLTDRS